MPGQLKEAETSNSKSNMQRPHNMRHEKKGSFWFGTGVEGWGPFLEKEALELGFEGLIQFHQVDVALWESGGEAQRRSPEF